VNNQQLETQERSRSDMAEMRELILQLVSNHGELRQVIEMQKSGDSNAGELVMLEGQRVGSSRLKVTSLIQYFFVGTQNYEGGNGGVFYVFPCRR
jgi:hypothetical protein